MNKLILSILVNSLILAESPLNVLLDFESKLIVSAESQLILSKTSYITKKKFFKEYDIYDW